MLTMRPPIQADRDAWDVLYQGYADFYTVTQTSAMRDTVWSWLMDEATAVYGRLAVDDSGAVLGLAHYRPFARPLSATTGGFLDDLFVAPQARGNDVAAQLIAAVKEDAASRGWSVLRWITAEDNYRARTVYDRIAEKTRWTTYDIRL